MTDIESLKNDYFTLIEQEYPPLIDLRSILLEIEDLINSPNYQELSMEERSSIQDIRKNLKSRLTDQEELNEESLRNLNLQSDISLEDHANNENLSSNATNSKVHNPQAEEDMEEAEKLFYGGRYVEAIKYFDKILQLEPNWERAKQHRAESENYLRTGYIPPVALPAEAASAFGKAQSAARVGRYLDAMNLINKAQGILRDLGIQRWQEGLEFEQKLQENIDAEKSFEEGLQFFSQGRFDEAIERIEAASRVTGSPKYNDKAQEFREVKELIHNIQGNLSNITVDPRLVSQAKVDLDRLTSEFDKNPAFDRLYSRIETVIPKVVAPLKDQVRSIKMKAERSTTIEETLFNARQAKAQLDQIQDLEGLDDSLDQLQSDVDQLIQRTTAYENNLIKAASLYESNPRWPSQAVRISQEVRRNYPNDPQVIRLNRSFSNYYAIQLLIKILSVLIILGIIGLLGWWITEKINDYRLSLIPTATSTTTDTPLPSATPSLTMTPTLTPTSTTTFTPTTTPIVGSAIRDIWARSGCYEGFNAIARIPAGSTLNFLPTERRFDQFNRECVLVEYLGETISTIGWVLIIDVGNLLMTPTP